LNPSSDEAPPIIDLSFCVTLISAPLVEGEEFNGLALMLGFELVLWGFMAECKGAEVLALFSFRALKFPPFPGTSNAR